MSEAFSRNGNAIDPARRWIWLAGAAILLLASFPQICGWLMTPEGFEYGGLLKNNGDALGYYSKMRQGFEGRWLYTDRFATEQHRPVLLFVFYLFLGHVARWTGLSIFVVYQIARVGCGAALLAAVDGLLRAMRLGGAARLLAFLFAFTAAGFAWALGPPLGAQDRPFEYWVTEAYAFQSMLNFPHFAAGTALMAWILGEMQNAKLNSSRAWIARVGVAAFLLAWVHPRLILNVVAVGAAAALLDWRRSRAALARPAAGLACVLLAAAGPMAATWLSLRGDIFWKAVGTPETVSPVIGVYLLGFGALWPLAARGAWIAWKKREAWAPLIIAWLAVGFYLVYLPLDSARRLIQGYNLPLAILAGYEVAEEIIPWARARLRLGPRGAFAAAAGIWLALSLSTWTLLAVEINHLRRRPYPWHYSHDLKQAMNWLNQNAGRDDVVMCAYRTGAALPGLAGCRVVMGHWAESPGANGKLRDTKTFFNAATRAEEREEVIARHDVRYALRGPAERDAGSYDPASDRERWESVFMAGDVSLCRIRPTGATQ